MASLKHKLVVAVGSMVAVILIVQLFIETRWWYARRTSHSHRVNPSYDLPLQRVPLSAPPSNVTILPLRYVVSEERRYQSTRNTSHMEKADSGSEDKNLTSEPSLIPPYTRHRGELLRDSYTIVIQTYKRNNILEEVLRHYCRASRVDQILVVWNNVGETVPSHLSGLGCSHKLLFIPQATNTIRNRFQPFTEIRTEGQLVDKT